MPVSEGSSLSYPHFRSASRARLAALRTKLAAPAQKPGLDGTGGAAAPEATLRRPVY
jgi:hypothetical protein